MTKYRVIIDKEKCVDCGISIGRCPVHAKLLARELEPSSKLNQKKCPAMGVFSKNFEIIKELVDRCPEKALVIKRIKKG